MLQPRGIAQPIHGYYAWTPLLGMSMVGSTFAKGWIMVPTFCKDRGAQKGTKPWRWQDLPALRSAVIALKSCDGACNGVFLFE